MSWAVKGNAFEEAEEQEEKWAARRRRKKEGFRMKMKRNSLLFSEQEELDWCFSPKMTRGGLKWVLLRDF